MRLWSLHPKYLDTKGLVACWSEGLLAQKVLQNRTEGYKKHPQLHRFKKQEMPLLHLSQYLKEIYKEGKKRKFTFDASKIAHFNYPYKINKIDITSGQICYEFNLLKYKLINREQIDKFKDMVLDMLRFSKIQLNPIFNRVFGLKENWEKGERL